MSDKPQPKLTIPAMKAAEKVLKALGCNASMRQMVAETIDEWADLAALLACAAERDKFKAAVKAMQVTIEELEDDVGRTW